jgi:hypothetical protein
MLIGRASQRPYTIGECYNKTLPLPFSLVRTVTNQHTQLRRLGALRAGNIDPVNLRLTLIDRDFNESGMSLRNQHDAPT